MALYRTIAVFNLVRTVGLAFVMWFAFTTGARAAEEVGKAVTIAPSVSGAGGALAAGSSIHRDERIRSSKSGVGQFVFRDGTKLAIGPNSSVVIDQFVFNDSNAVQNMTLNAAKGTFRWISGSSKSSAYKIKTPMGTLGVRGTAFDVYVGPRTAAVLLLSGKVLFCGNNGGCKSITKRCGILIADRSGVKNGGPENRARGVIAGVRNEQSFPFATGNKELAQAFRKGGASCFGTGSVGSEDPSDPGTGDGGGNGGELEEGNPNGPN